MTNPSPATSTVATGPDGAALRTRFQARFEALDQLGASLTDREWYAPSAVTAWSVLDVYAHLIGAESALEGYELPYCRVDVAGLDHVTNRQGVENETWIESLSHLKPPALLDRFRRITTARLRTIAALPATALEAPADSPLGPVTLRRQLQIRLFDLWMHEQDVREGLGRPGNPAGTGAEDALDEVVRRLGPALAGRVAVPDGTTVWIDLTGPLERRLQLVAGAGQWRVTGADRPDPAGGHRPQPAARITLSSSLFLRLAGGRIDVLSPRLGAIDFDGDLDLATAVATGLTVTE